MLKLSKPEQTITENGITYLLRTPEQVEQDLTRLVQKYDLEDDFKTYWRKLLSAKIPVCPVCGEAGGPIRNTAEEKILGCDRCLVIAGYYDADELIGVKEAAEILGWDTRRVTTYRSRGSFPEPVTELAMGPVWTREQIENYKREKTAK
jgi:hypothetical protein